MSEFYDNIEGEAPPQVKRRYVLTVHDDDNDTPVIKIEHLGYSDVGLQEQLRKVDMAFDRHEQALAEANAPDEDTLYDRDVENKMEGKDREQTK